MGNSDQKLLHEIHVIKDTAENIAGLLTKVCSEQYTKGFLDGQADEAKTTLEMLKKVKSELAEQPPAYLEKCIADLEEFLKNKKR